MISLPPWRWRIALLTGLLLIIGVSSAQAQSDTLRITSGAGPRGASVPIDLILVNPVNEVGGFVVTIGYDPAVVSVTTVSTTARTAIFEQFPNMWNVDTSHAGFIRIVCFSWRGDFIARGNGAVARFSFRISSTAPYGVTPIHFDTLYENDNQLSDRQGNLILPVLMNGSINVGGTANQPPSISVASSYEAFAGSPLQFFVTASDPNTDSVTLSASNLPTGATFPTVKGYQSVQGTFYFVPADSQAYHSYQVTFAATDGVNTPVTAVVTINVNPAGGGNRSPTFMAIGVQTVTEGSHLEFAVTAYDLDGDSVFIQGQNLPPNSRFTSVRGDSIATGTFTFDPDFTQGPDTLTVRFVATDNRGGSSQANVTIIVIDAPNDILRIPAGQGALPASVGRHLIVDLINAEAIYGLQFDLIYSPAILTIGSVTPAARAQDMAFFSQLLAPGRYRVLMFSFGAQTIASGSGTIVDFVIDVASNAPFGPSLVSFDSATSVRDSVGGSSAIVYSPGSFIVDRLGDANLDGLISVGDCVAIVASLLQRTTLSLRAADAADFDRDGRVRITDLMMVVNFILNRPILSPPLPRYAGTVQLLRDGLLPGGRAELPMVASLGVEGAAVQFAIEYDPSEVVVHRVLPGDLISGLRMEYEIQDDRVLGVIYDLDLSVFGPGVGELVRLDVEAVGDSEKPATALRLTDFQMVNIDAQTLNIEVVGELPTTYALAQNYPNPFNTSTSIRFDLPKASHVRLVVYNLLGQEVKVLMDDYLEAGTHVVHWDGTDSYGGALTSGVYFYRMIADSFDRARKMVLVK